MYSEDELLPLSALQHVLFCERRAALICTERLWEDNVSTVEGNLIHERAHREEMENRSNIRIVRGLWLRSLRLGIYGKADVVEFRLMEKGEEKDDIYLTGRMPVWQPFPVEYKRGRIRSEVSFEVQLCAQGICLEEMLGVEVSSGALYYGKTRRRMELKFDVTLRETTEAAASRLHEIVNSGVTPRAWLQKKCRYCSMNELCLPKLSIGTKNVRNYLMQATHNREEANETPP